MLYWTRSVISDRLSILLVSGYARGSGSLGLTGGSVCVCVCVRACVRACVCAHI